MMSTPGHADGMLRIAINAQIQHEVGAGGIESVLIGLVHALGQLPTATEEYVIIGPWNVTSPAESAKWVSNVVLSL